MALTKSEIQSDELRISLAMQIKSARAEDRAKKQIETNKLLTKKRGDDVRFSMEIDKIMNLDVIWDDL